MNLPKEFSDLTEADLIALTNKMTVKRAIKDLAADMSPEVIVQDDALKIIWSDAQCVLPPGGLGSASCSCPARSKSCRHRVRSVMWLLKNHKPKEDSGVERNNKNSSWNPSCFDDKILKKAGGAKVWKKALKMAQVGPAVRICSGNIVEIPLLGIRVRFIPDGSVKAALCNCSATSVCEHTLLAALAYRKKQPAEIYLPSGDEDQKALKSRLEDLVSELLTVGLDGLPGEVAQTFGTLAQRAAVGLPGAARDLRRLAALITSRNSRSARFNLRNWLVSLGRLGARVLSLSSEKPPAAVVGVARRAYFDVVSLEMIGVGSEGFQGPGGTVITSWFMAIDSRTDELSPVTFLKASLGRGEDYGGTIDDLWRVPLWDEIGPRRLSGQRLVLRNGRLAGGGVLSGSDTTRISLKGKAKIGEFPWITRSEQLREMWSQVQVPFIFRDSGEQLLPALVALDQNHPFGVPRFSDISQTLKIPLYLRDKGALILSIKEGPATDRVLLQVLANCNQWITRPTHAFVRCWPTEQGMMAVPVSFWIDGRPACVAFADGSANFFSDSVLRKTLEISAEDLEGDKLGYNPSGLSEHSGLRIIRELIDLLELISAEGLIVGIRWHEEQLRDLAVGLKNLQLNYGANCILELIERAGPEFFIYLLVWALELEERCVLDYNIF